jgi:hypothetical protein
MKMRKWAVVMLLACFVGLSGCELLRFPFNFVASILEAIPELLMLSDASDKGQQIPSEKLAVEIEKEIQKVLKREHLPDGYETLRSCLANGQGKFHIARLSLTQPYSQQKILSFCNEMQKKGKVRYFVVDGSSLRGKERLSVLTEEIRLRGGRLFSLAGQK